MEKYLYTKEILIDDSGWGDLILGVVIGALKLPERRYMERRIPISSFQSSARKVPVSSIITGYSSIAGRILGRNFSVFIYENILMHGLSSKSSIAMS